MHEPHLESSRRVLVDEVATSLRAMFGDDVTLVEAIAHCDTRGRLIELDPAKLPFAVRRVFTVGEVPPGTRRGQHRHRFGSQALFCTAGRVDVGLRRGTTAHAPVTLTPGSLGLCISAGVWSEQHYVVDGASLLVMASDPYDPNTYDSDV